MKKLYFMMALILCAMSATAQNYNLFSASDIDKDGWLWFDTQAKVDKYVGTCDEDNYKAVHLRGRGDTAGLRRGRIGQNHGAGAPDY